MTISYAQASNPYWYFSDLTGKSAGSGQVFFYSSLNPDNLKTVYQDSAGLLAYSNPIDINLNGTIGPIYFAVNSADAADNYDIYAYDAQGNLIEQILNFTPPSGSGGGGGTTVLNLKNIVPNNIMYRHISTITPVPIYQPLAPSAHQGLALDPNWQPSSVPATYGPNIVFLKNNTSATDTISFPVFALGLLPMSPSDTTPVDYFQYSCTGAGASENLKCVQFPITSKIQNLSNQVVSGTIWGICTSGNTALTINSVQYFGNGTAASNPTNTGNTVVTPLASITLTNTWEQYTFTAQTIPSVSDGTIGQCGNDGLFLQIGLPLNSATTIGFSKPCIYLGSNYTALNYESYDSISSVFDEPHTGDTRLSLDNINTFWSFGWVPANDGSIGSSASPATTRANLDTFPLYNLLWNFIGVVYAPMLDGNAYGATSTADFTANRAILLTKQAGRLLGGIGTSSATNTFLATSGSSPNLVLTSGTTLSYPVGIQISFSIGMSGVLPISSPALVAGQIYFVKSIVDATTFTISATNGGAEILFTTPGTAIINVISGNNTAISWGLGQFTGNEQTNQVASHNHGVTNTMGVSGTVSIGTFQAAANTGVNALQVNNVNPHSFPLSVALSGGVSINSDGIAEVNIQNPVSYQVVYVKL